MTHLELQKKYEELRTEMQARTDGLHRMLSDATREREELRDANTRLTEANRQQAAAIDRIVDADRDAQAALRAENTRQREAMRSAITSADVALRALQTFGGAVVLRRNDANLSTAKGQLGAVIARLLGALPMSEADRASDNAAIRQPEPRP